MAEELAAVRDLLPGVRLAEPVRLRGNDRSTVHRVSAGWPDGTRRSLIVKQYSGAGEGWVREAAALATLPANLAGPRTVAESAEPAVLVVADLGPGGSVADALLGDDADAAEAALCSWARAIAALHTTTLGLREAFRAELDARQGELPVTESRGGVDLEDTVRALDRECGALGVRVPAGAFDELRGLAKRLGSAGPAALTPADACPDNNVATPAGLVLLDYEGAQWRHVAWDVAYLRVPWPSCWCSWRLPDDVAERAVAAYRAAAAPALPAVADAAFERDMTAAVVGWALISTTWFIDHALGADPPLDAARPMPSRRAMIQHRLRQAAHSAELPAAAELAGRLDGVLRSRWGDVPLALAPAFRAAQ
jgi:hypothetical protein